MHSKMLARAMLTSSLSLLALLTPAAVSAQVEDATSASYDYVIIGGGTSGLVVANRLTEDPSVTVAVIEPGGDVRNNSNVYDPHKYPAALGTALDWNYTFAPQVYNGVSRVQTHSAGKAIGGTSTINGMTYVRAQAVQIDGWEQLGNPGWNWTSMWPYYLKHNTFQPPTDSQVQDAGMAYNPKNYGNGPVKLGWEYTVLNGSMHSIQNQTWQNLGYKYNSDVNGGDELGFTLWPREVDRALNRRSDAATAYYWPLQRSNLKLVPGFANRIVFSSNTSGNVTASGVQYTSASGQAVTVNARKEVILAAGSLKSPAILELSGIGNPTVLSRYGIKTLVNNTGVGEHMQDQPNIAFLYSELPTAMNGTQPYATFGKTSDFFGSNTSAIAARTNASIPQWAQQAAAVGNGSVSAAAWETIFRIQWDLLFNKNIPAGEMLNSHYYSTPAPTALTAFWPLIPFSRGNVHIGSADPTVKPTINFNYFAVDYDKELIVAMAKQVRKFYNTAPASSVFTNETSPGLKKVPKDASDDVWAAHILGKFKPNHHAIGTNAMLSRELGGVVDSRLKVYGTTNLRVVDASVLPSQISGHLTATVYAIAERAADIIKRKI